jgi:putative ABC transport system permease protein
MKSILAPFVCALCVTASAAACRERNQYIEPPASSFTVTTVELATDSARDSVRAASVQPDFFQASNVRALLGRLLVADEFRNAAPSTLIISKDLWDRRFRSDPTVIGRKLRLNGQEATIVGVVPADFTFPNNVSAWVPGPPK